MRAFPEGGGPARDGGRERVACGGKKTDEGTARCIQNTDRKRIPRIASRCHPAGNCKAVLRSLRAACIGHFGACSQYLDSIRRTDGLCAELWRRPRVPLNLRTAPTFAFWLIAGVMETRVRSCDFQDYPTGISRARILWMVVLGAATLPGTPAGRRDVLRFTGDGLSLLDWCWKCRTRWRRRPGRNSAGIPRLDNRRGPRVKFDAV